MSAQSEALAALERDWPDWELWLVPQYIGGTVWCARCHDDHTHVLNAGSPAGLVEMLEAAAGSAS